MGQHEGQKELFSYQVDLHRRVGRNPTAAGADDDRLHVRASGGGTHVRRQRQRFGRSGVLLKLMFLLFHENVRSERELCGGCRSGSIGCGSSVTASMRRCPITACSRRRGPLGRGLFEQLFVHTVQQCV